MKTVIRVREKQGGRPWKLAQNETCLIVETAKGASFSPRAQGLGSWLFVLTGHPHECIWAGGFGPGVSVTLQVPDGS